MLRCGGGRRCPTEPIVTEQGGCVQVVASVSWSADSAAAKRSESVRRVVISRARHYILQK